MGVVLLFTLFQIVFIAGARGHHEISQDFPKSQDPENVSPTYCNSANVPVKNWDPELFFPKFWSKFIVAVNRGLRHAPSKNWDPEIVSSKDWDPANVPSKNSNPKYDSPQYWNPEYGSSQVWYPENDSSKYWNSDYSSLQYQKPEYFPLEYEYPEYDYSESCGPRYNLSEWILNDREKDLFRKYELPKGVSPDVIPHTYLEILYKGKPVRMSEMLKPKDVIEAPTLIWACNDCRNYTVIMVEVGALGANKGNQYLRWKISNIYNCDLNNGEVKAPYRPPATLPGIGATKLLFLIFDTSYDENSSGLKKGLDTTLQATSGRVEFSTAEMIKKYGTPLGGNFYRQINELVQTDVAKVATKLPAGGITNVVHGLTQ